MSFEQPVYHISSAGKAERCYAKIKCRLGGEHYGSEIKAQTAHLQNKVRELLQGLPEEKGAEAKQIIAALWENGYDQAEDDREGTGFWATGMRGNPVERIPSESAEAPLGAPSEEDKRRYAENPALALTQNARDYILDAIENYPDPRELRDRGITHDDIQATYKLLEEGKKPLLPIKVLRVMQTVTAGLEDLDRTYSGVQWTRKDEANTYIQAYLTHLGRAEQEYAERQSRGTY